MRRSVIGGWGTLQSYPPSYSDYEGTYPFVGGTIERVVVDVSGDHYVDHEKEVLAYLARD